MYCNQEIETMPRLQMVQLQTERLRKTVKWVYEKSPFYREKMNAAGLTDKSVQVLADLEKLPFTTKDDLVKASPFGFLTIPLSGTIRMRMIGNKNPVNRAYTSGDIARNVEMMARCLIAGGVNVSSVIEVMDDYSGDNALSVQYAGELLGATVIPSDVEKIECGLEMVEKLGVNMIASNIQKLLQRLVASQAFDYDVKLSHLSALFSFNDSVKNNMEDHLMNRFNANIFNLYSPPEFGCAGIAFECAQKDGMHVNEDYFYPEVISMTDQKILEPGRVGELVLTSLALEAMPILRYRTGQIVSLDSETCKCGRTLVRAKMP